MNHIPERVYRVSNNSEVKYLESKIAARDFADNCDSVVEYIRKDKSDELIQQLLWQYAGTKL